jgi:hypothetical protein
MSKKLMVLCAGDESTLDKVILFVDASFTRREAENRIEDDGLLPAASVMLELELTEEQSYKLADALDEQIPYMG